LTATTMPMPERVGFMVFSSTQPLYTRPNPPSPSTVSGLKLRVADRSSAKVNTRRLGASRMRPSGDAAAAARLLLLQLPLLPPPLRVVAALLMDEPGDLLLGCPDELVLMEGSGSGGAMGSARAGAAGETRRKLIGDREQN